MVFLEVEMQRSTLIPTNQLVQRSSQGRNPSLNGKLRIRKSSNEHEFLLLSLLWARLVKGGSETLLVTSSFLWPSSMPCSLWSWRIRDLTGASCPIMSWCKSRTTRIFLALGQKFWLLKWSPIRQTSHFMSTSMNAKKTLEPAPTIWPQPEKRTTQ